jgi:TolA-binding protein
MMADHCDRMAELALSEAEGVPLTSQDTSFRQLHLATCPSCRRERQALSILDIGADRGVHFPLDERARARIVNRTLALIDAPAEALDEAAPSASLLEQRQSRRREFAAFGALAAAAAVLVAVRLGAPVKAGPALAQEVPVARVLLASGQLQGSEPLAVGMVLAEGQSLESGSGELSLALGPHAVALVEPHSKLTLERLDRDGIELALDQGRVHSSITPRSLPSFAVATRAGKVEVTGTVFAVEVHGERAEVSVLRGSVSVTAPGKATASVEALRVRELGGDEGRPMSRAEQDRSLAAQRRLSLLEPALPSGLQIRSRPEGAQVSLDGEPLGQTPFAAEVKAGRRHLVVAMAGRTSEEWVDLHTGDLTLRDYDLSAPEPKPTNVPSKPARATAPSTPTARVPSAPAQDLSREAQERRARRDFKGAAATLRELIATYPASPLSDAARVVLGQIEVEHLANPAAALRICDSYLARAPRGALASEALSCKASALRALGLTAEERRVLEAFIARFPQAAQAAELGRRLEALQDR